MANRRYEPSRTVSRQNIPTYDDVPAAEPEQPQAPTAPVSNNPYSRGGYQTGRNPISYQGGNDINKQYVNNRDMNQGQGDAFEGEFSQDVQNRRNMESDFGGRAFDAYGQLEQTPGYTGQESEDILRQQDIEGLRDGVNYGQNYLDSWENDAIRGNPYGGMDYLDPEGLTNTNYDNFQRTMGGVNNTESKLGANVNDTRSAMQSSINPDALRQSEDYKKWTGAVLDTTGNKVWDAATNKDLDMSGEYARQGGMTDDEVTAQGTTAGQALGAGYRSAVQDLERQAAASGNASPLAVAAARRQFEDQNAVGQADAVSTATGQARQMQREAAQNVENTRAAANRYKSNAQMQAGTDMGRFAQDTLNTVEANRQATERDLSNRSMDVAQTTGQMGQQAGMYTGAQGLAALESNANREYQAGLHNETARVGQFNRGETANAEREAMLGTNRQAVSQANQNATWNRGYQANQALSNRNTGVADARRQGQQENRNYLTGQQSYQGQQGNVANQARLTNRSQTQQGNQAATQGLGNYELGQKSAPGVLDKINKVISIGSKISSMGGG